MVTAPPELSQFLNVIPGYSEVSPSKNVWLIIWVQWFFCLVWSFFLSYYAYKKLYGDRKKSWKRFVQSIGPILRRIQNLEKEKMIWYSYMEWIEEYCNVYYGLLNFTNLKVIDLEKLIKTPYEDLKSVSETTSWSKENMEDPKKSDEEVMTEKEVVDKEKWKDPSAMDDFQILTDFARVFQTLKTIHDCSESEGAEVVIDGTRSFTVSDIPSTIGTTEDYFRDELESFRESSEDDAFAKTCSPLSQI